MKLLRRSLAVPAAVLALAGCGGSTTVNGPTIQPPPTYQLVDFKPVRPDRARQAGARLVRDPAAGRHAAHAVQDRARARTRAST